MINPVCKLFNINYPIIQAGMVWCSGWRLASAVSDAGGLGLIGAGSMHPGILRTHIINCKNATSRPFGVNVPLLYPDIQQVMDIIIEEKVPIVFTSAGNPVTWTGLLKDHGISVAHVIANSKFAKKAESAGADAVVAEGFEAGGHNGREETTTFCLLPAIKESVSIPVIAAGGIASGQSMLAAIALGADAVQVGSRFAASAESSAHINFKNAIIAASEGDTRLSLKKLVPVRLLKNEFYRQVEKLESAGADREELLSVLGKGRSKLGMFEGDMANGELEIGQISATINAIQPAAQILEEIWDDFLTEKKRISNLNWDR